MLSLSSLGTIPYICWEPAYTLCTLAWSSGTLFVNSQPGTPSLHVFAYLGTTTNKYTFHVSDFKFLHQILTLKNLMDSSWFNCFTPGLSSDQWAVLKVKIWPSRPTLSTRLIRNFKAKSMVMTPRPSSSSPFPLTNWTAVCLLLTTQVREGRSWGTMEQTRKASQRREDVNYVFRLSEICRRNMFKRMTTPAVAQRLE